MKKKYLMGVDVGTQSAKVLIFDLEGNVVCQSRHPLRRLDIPAPLLAEHPDDDVWDSLKRAFRAAMARFTDDLNADPRDILAMGLCVIRCCRVLLKEDGRLAYPVINWMDKRLNTPFQYEKKYRDVRYVTTSSGYITHRLTRAFKDTCANYIGWWPMDNRRFDWSTDPDRFNQCGLDRGMLFDVVKPGEILGHVTDRAAAGTGLPKGLPVVATAHDKAVEALGSGTLEPGTALVSLGTYIGAMVHGKEYIENGRHFWTFPASVPNRYLYECMGVRRGMWTVSWFCDQFGRSVKDEAGQKGISIEEMFNREAALVPPGCEGLITVHDWAPPAEAVFRKGVMFGFDGRHTRAHIYRSILEGIAFTMKNHMDKMIEELGFQLKQLIISGGGANSDLFMQIFADIFGIKTVRNRLNGSAAIGCAVNAGMAVHAFKSYDHAIEKMASTADAFSPDIKTTRFYDRINETVYKQVNPHFDPLLKQLSGIVDREPSQAGLPQRCIKLLS